MEKYCRIHCQFLLKDQNTTPPPCPTTPPCPAPSPFNFFPQELAVELLAIPGIPTTTPTTTTNPPTTTTNPPTTTSTRKPTTTTSSTCVIMEYVLITFEFYPQPLRDGILVFWMFQSRKKMCCLVPQKRVFLFLLMGIVKNSME
uniref:Uncharacterized protein n=1 Tax=Strongyloides papillosus TaxID=174720 RepID=A0A0N5BZ41_STREA